MQEVLRAAKAEGAVVDTIVLPGGTVLPCKARDTCYRRCFCPQKDDFEAIWQEHYELWPKRSDGDKISHG